jgi:hypothetical protein
LHKETVLGRLSGSKGAEWLLAEVGFVDASAHIVLPVEANLVPLQQSLERIVLRESALSGAPQPASRAAAKPLEQKNAQQRALEAVLAENNKAANELLIKKQQAREEIKQRSLLARKENASRAVQSSHANDLRFGATLAVHKPPPPAPKGG